MVMPRRANAGYREVFWQNFELPLLQVAPRLEVRKAGIVLLAAKLQVCQTRQQRVNPLVVAGQRRAHVRRKARMRRVGDDGQMLKGLIHSFLRRLAVAVNARLTRSSIWRWPGIRKRRS